MSIKKIAFLVGFLLSGVAFAQHRSVISVEAFPDQHRLMVTQDLTFTNDADRDLTTVLLNDWNNAYSSNESLLGRRFSDEFVRSFLLASEKERGKTTLVDLLDDARQPLQWSRPEIDLIEIQLPKPLAPGLSVTLHIAYLVDLPSDQFTHYGYDGHDNLTLKDWCLSPARLVDGQFIRYSNGNLDDIANGLCDYQLTVKVPLPFTVDSDLDRTAKTHESGFDTYKLEGRKRNNFNLFIAQASEFYSFKNNAVEVLTNVRDNKVTDIDKAIIIDRVVQFVREKLGDYPYKIITVSQADYDRNPFYGLNQLPSFLSPFRSDFLYELKFLKTYTNNFVRNSIHLDGRKDNWIYDAIQLYVMMQYIDTYQPDSKMMGSLAKWKILRGYNLMQLQFNEQYSYYYMLMARKNLDQPLGASKETLIRFNERIASKYRAGLSLKYLDNFLGDEKIPGALQSFYMENRDRLTDRRAFEAELRNTTDKNLDWFFDKVIDSREIIDYTFGKVKVDGDQVTMTLKNRTGTTVPIPVYGLRHKQIVFKKWFENVETQSTFTIDLNAADKLVINYANEVPEFNLRNNWHSLKTWIGNDRPYKFAFMKDLEDPRYNQILYVPTITYNLYDGLSPGMRIHNKTLLDKPVNFDVNPVYSVKTQSLTGSASILFNQYNRDSQWYNTRFGVSTNYYHYAPDAAYFKINPSVTFLIREKDFRDNRRQSINLRYNIVRKDRSAIVIDSVTNYSVFSAQYASGRTEVARHLNYFTNVQFSDGFGKVSGELQFRKLFPHNRQFNIRFFAGTFLYNKTNSHEYSFGISNPNDYMFDYNFFGRSEKTGFLSQQLLIGDGAFKSKVMPDAADRWITATNISFSIWNWIEAYGDLGMAKNHGADPKFLYDSGIRLNLVTDYFELYFPVYSNLGWEIAQPNYQERIRFIFTFSPKSLINLFTRKWF